MNKREQHIQFLKGLREGMNFSTAAWAETSKAELDKYIAHASMDLGDEKTKKIQEQYDNLRAAALNGEDFTYNRGNPEKERRVNARAEINRIFVARINNFMAPMATALEFFETVSLPDNGIPYYENTTSHEHSIAIVGEDGGARESAVVKAQTQTQIPLYVMKSEKVKYQLWDVLRGNVADENAKLVEIARDQALNLNKRLWTALKTTVSGSTGVIGSFALTGAKVSRVFNLHSTIESDNIPTTNVISETTDGYFGKKCLDKVFQYSAKWADLFADGDIYPTSIFLPSGAALGGIGDVGLTTQPNSLNEQMITKGYIQSYLGRNVVYRPIPTLAVASKAAYVKFNRVPGIFFEKRGMDRMINKLDEEENEGSMMNQKVWGAVIPKQRNPFIVKVTYAS